MLTLMAIVNGSTASEVDYPAPPLRMPAPISYVMMREVPTDLAISPDVAGDGIDMSSSSEAPRSFPVTPMAPPSTPEGKLQIYMRELSKGFDARIRSVIPKISGTPRQLLALKYYLRRNQDIKGKWAWTPKEITRYKQSPQYRESIAEITRVKLKFAELNPGYTLGVNTEVRTLDDQIENWNQTGSIQAAAAGLANAAMKAIVDTNAYDTDVDKASLLRFRNFLDSYRVAYVPTVAVPGFSQHGQLRAFDFVIKQGNDIVAGTETGSIGSLWDRSGWTAKLNEAITQASNRFAGPLAAPREPWHYTYLR
jgi:hypothetical protein